MLFKIDCQENQGKSELGLINIIRIENHFEVLHFLNFMHKIWLLNQGLTSEHVRTQKKINFLSFSSAASNKRASGAEQNAARYYST